MKRGCCYIDAEGRQCGRAYSKHGGYILSGPGAGTHEDHPVLKYGFEREEATRLSARWRAVFHPVKALPNVTSEPPQ